MDTLAVAFRNNLALGNGWLLGGRPSGNRKARRTREVEARKVVPRRNVGEARRLAHELGASVWSATDSDDLADLLDASLDDPAIGRSAVQVAGALFCSELGELSNFPSFARAIDAKASDDVVPDLLEGMRFVSVISGLFRKGRAPQNASQSSSLGADTWGDLDLYSLPLPMLESALAGIRSLICLAALVDLGLAAGRSPPTWLVKQVVRGWVDGDRSFLRLLTMFHGGENVPEDLLPRAQRLDQAQMVEDHNQGEVIFEQFLADAMALQ